MTCTLVSIKDIPSSLWKSVSRFKNINSGLKNGKILYGLILVFSLFSANSIFSGYGQPIVNVQEASAQLDPTSALFGNPGTSDFLSLAIALVPTIQGADLNVSNVAGTTECDLLVPVTYIDGGCMSSLPLLTPITYQPNLALPVNDTVYFTDYNQSSTMAIQIGLSSDNITAGETQTISVTVSDGNSTEPISGAYVYSNITDSYGTSLDYYTGTTDDTGQTSFDYAVPIDALSDFYDVTVTATADGYENHTESTIFEVIGSDYDDFYDNSTSDDYNYDDGDYDYDDGSSSDDDDCCDYDSPTVKSVDPQDNENNVALNTEIKVTFDEKMDEDTLDDGSLDIFNQDGGPDPGVDANPSSKSVTYTLDRQLEPGTEYEAELDFNIQDEDGNYLDCTDSNDVDSSCRWQFVTTGTGGSANIELTPTSGPFGTEVGVSGTGFDTNSDVIINFDGNEVRTTPTDNNGDFNTDFDVPVSLAGDYTVTASDGFNSDSKTFTVTSSSSTAIILTPKIGAVGDSVSVVGINFDPGTAVTLKFDGTTVTTTPTTVMPGPNGGFTATFTVPSSSSGEKTVSASQGSKTASKPFTVTSTTSPAIALNPTTGAVGDSVSVVGINFDPGTAVTLKFDGTTVTTTSTTVMPGPNGGFTATFTVPASSDGSKAVLATQGSKTASKSFTVTSSSAPSITLNPTSGPVGTSITVSGTGFDPSSVISISFDGDPVATSPPTVTPTGSGGFTASFSIPSTSSTGPKSVVASQGDTSAEKPFTVTSATSAAITLNPTSGPAGDSVTVTGTGFDSSSVVSIYFDGNPVATTPTTVMPGTNGGFTATFTVPASSDGSKTVVANQGDTSASKSFTVTPDVSSSTLSILTDTDESVLSNFQTSNSEVNGNTSPATTGADNKTSDTKSSKSTDDTKSSSDEGKEQDRKDRALFEEYLRSGDMGPDKGGTSEINIRPVAKNDESATVQNVPVSIDILANDKDADGKDDLKIVGTSPPHRGKVDLNSNDSITYFPDKGWAGTDVFDYTISDGKGGIAMASVAVKVGVAENNVPKVESETVSVNENSPEKIKLKATDADGGDRLIFKIVKEPSHGKIAEFKSSEGTLTYLPDRDYKGKDGFGFIVTDGKSESKEGQITIEIKPGKDLAEGEQATDQKQQQEQKEQKEPTDQPQEKQSDGDSSSGDNNENKDNQQSSTSEDNKGDQSDEQKQQDDQPKEVEKQESEPPKEDTGKDTDSASD